MSQATISHQSTSARFSFEGTFPYLRTLVDMLLLTGGLFFAFIPTRCLFHLPTTAALAIFMAGCWLSFIASVTLVFLTARSNRLAHRQTAFICVSIIMLMYASVSVVVCSLLPNTEVIEAVYLLTLGVAVWGLTCVGLISTENRIAAHLELEEVFTSNFTIKHTIQRLFYLPVGLMFSLEWIILPAWLIYVAINGYEYPEETYKHAVQPNTILEVVALCTIMIWVMLAKCGIGIFYWAFLKTFHTPGIDLSKELKKDIESPWAKPLLSFLLISMLGAITLGITCNATSFGPASAPWILAGMIGFLAIACWRLRRTKTDG